MAENTPRCENSIHQIHAKNENLKLAALREVFGGKTVIWCENCVERDRIMIENDRIAPYKENIQLEIEVTHQKHPDEVYYILDIEDGYYAIAHAGKPEDIPDEDHTIMAKPDEIEPLEG